MKNKIQFLLFVAILFFSISTYSQVTVSVQNLQYTNNGQSTISPANCGNIDLATSTSTSINLGINLSKPNGQVVGLSDLRVYTQKSSSDSRVERSWVQIQESFWTTSQPNTYSTTASFSINSSDFNVSGGTLFVVFKSSGNVEYQTACSFTITKTPLPSFSLSPTTTSFACGDTSSRTFTVTPSNIPSGASVTYQWSYSGWTLISQTATSRTLQPSSATSLPSTVTITPFINGVAQNSRTSTVSRPAFTSSANITGNNSICTPATTGSYSISGLLAGQSVTWSSSNTAIATVSPVTGNNTIVTRVGNGTFNLIAKITNQCGEFVNIQRSIRFGGAPLFTVQQNTGVTSNIEVLTLKGINNANIANEQITNVVWEEVQLNNADCGDVFGSGGVNAYVDYYVNNCNMQVKVTATNSCGSTIVYKTVQNNRVSGGTESRLSQNNYSVFPNPAKDVVTIELIDQENQTKKNTTISGELFDIMGQSKSKVQVLDNKATFSVSQLKKGIYILKIYINDQVEIHQIAVE
jgi:hypothetical protein